MSNPRFHIDQLVKVYVDLPEIIVNIPRTRISLVCAQPAGFEGVNPLGVTRSSPTDSFCYYVDDHEWMAVWFNERYITASDSDAKAISSAESIEATMKQEKSNG